jgi:putative tricarboxylic transport membrane protein
MRERPVATFNRDHWASLFFLATGMGICLWSVQYDIGTFAGPGPGFIGLCAGGAVSLLSLAGFLSNWRKVKDEERLFGPHWQNGFIILLLLLAFALLLNLLGFLICTFLFMFILLRRTKIYSWKVVLSWSLGTVMVMHFVFEVWLQAQLPKGLLRHIGF